MSHPSHKRLRLDQLLVQRGLVASREKAQQVIRAGTVTANGLVVTKPGHTYAEDTELAVAAPPPFVGRGGEKLAAAFKAFPFSVTGAVCLDVGASTGGFTDCLLQHGARHVYAVDVGKGQLHWKLRTDKRVTVYEGCNARYLTADWFPEVPVVAVVDVAFISLTKVLPAITTVLASDSQLVTLVKPQFEARREQVGKGGVVRSDDVRQEVLERVRRWGETECGLHWLDSVTSPLTGPAGNTEYLAYWRSP